LTRTREVISKFVELADSNISDPVVMRANDENSSWIYDHFPKYGKNATLPRIGFHKINTTHDFQGLGNTEFSTIADIQASIMVRKGKSYDIDDDGDNEPAEDIADYLADELKTITEQNQDSFRNISNEVLYVVPISSDTVKPENKNIILEAMTFEVRLQQV